MDFIISNAEGIEIDLLKERQYIDMDCGGENDFEIQISRKLYKSLGITEGWRIGVQGKEYGGIIDTIKNNSSSNNVTLSGMTWRGLLTKKIIEPTAGEDYRTVSGDVNTIINDIVCADFDGIFVCDDLSGITVKNYHFDRYVDDLAGIEKMLATKNARIEIAYDSGEPGGASFVRLFAVPITDWSDEIEYSKDGTLSFLSFEFEQYSGGINHLICLGKGELKDRLVIHLYIQEDGSIGDKQFYTGKDERTSTFVYSNTEDEAELKEQGAERLKALRSYTNMDMTLRNQSMSGMQNAEDIAIGDIVGGRDFDTGIYLCKQITRKIVQVKNGKEGIDYSVGENAVSRSTSSAPSEAEDVYQKQIDNIDNKLALIDVTDDLTGMAIGKAAEAKNVFDVALETKFGSHLILQANAQIKVKNSSGNIREVIQVTESDEYRYGVGSYYNSEGSTTLYGNNIILCSRNGTYANNVFTADYIHSNNYIQAASMNAIQLSHGTNIATAFTSWKYGVVYCQSSAIEVYNAPGGWNSGQYIAYYRVNKYTLIANVYSGWFYYCDTTNDVINGWQLIRNPNSDAIYIQGTSGIWTYRKWDSGIAECWCRKSNTISGITKAWGNIYCCDNAMPSVAYPFDFTDDPIILANEHRNSGGNYWLYTNGNTAQSTPFYGVARGSSYSDSFVVTVDFYVVGKWK